MHFVPPKEIADRVMAAGLQVEHRPLHRGRLHPHHLIVARKAG